MGIKDLLRFMKPYIDPIHIKKYAGQRVGIDAYSWLHKGAYSCSMELCLDIEGRKKLKYIDYFMHRINLLRHYKITPVVVFDGGNIPCKAATEDERHRRRKANRELAMEKLNEGNVGAASELFQRAISITPAMAHQLIQVLKSGHIEFIVAPYEADAQLAYLASLEAEQGGIAAVITEDSDLLAYGCKAVIFKMDRHGNGEELVLENVFQATDQKPSFHNFDKDLFIGMCVLAGCDFLPSVPGIGISKAHSFVSKYRNLDRILTVLKIEKGKLMPEDYSKSFTEAVAVFQHARVYDRDAKKLKYMKPLSKNLLHLPDEELDFLGPLTITMAIRELTPSIAAAIAEGSLDPINIEAFNHFPHVGCHPNLAAYSSGRFQKQDKDSTFLVCSSKSRGSKELKRVAVEAERESRPVVEEIRYCKQDSDLDKLILQPKGHLTMESTDVQSMNPLKIPDNNPFKRRKVDEISLEHMKNAAEELKVSFVTEVEELEARFLVPEENPISPKSTLNISSKEGRESMVHSTRMESSGIRQVSEIIETERSRISGGIGVESQESKIITTESVCRVKVTSTNGKVKTSCRSSENKKKSSIPDFFRRL